MSENTDHETGGTFANEDIVTEQSANTKYILVQAAAPTTPYDGQISTNTSSDPPIQKVYDATNTAYLERRPIWYETTSSAVPVVPTATPTINGTLVLQYEEGGSGTTLFVKSATTPNDWWRRAG